VSDLLDEWREKVPAAERAEGRAAQVVDA